MLHPLPPVVAHIPVSSTLNPTGARHSSRPCLDRYSTPSPWFCGSRQNHAAAAWTVGTGARQWLERSNLLMQPILTPKDAWTEKYFPEEYRDYVGEGIATRDHVWTPLTVRTVFYLLPNYFLNASVNARGPNIYNCLLCFHGRIHHTKRMR